MKKQTATIPWEAVLPTFELMTMDWQIMFHYIQVGLFSRLNAISLVETWFWNIFWHVSAAAAAAKSLQLCPTLCDPIDGSPPGSTIPGILQARTLEWVAISFSSAWKWKVKVKLLSLVWLFATPWTAAYQARPSMKCSRQEYWGGVPLPSPWHVSRFHLL